MKQSLSILFACLLILSACGKKDNPQTRFDVYHANPHYNGSHDTTNFTATLYLKEASLDIDIQVDLTGTSDTLEYPVSIHAADSTAMYGYNPTATLFIGNYKGGIPLIKTLSSYDFTTFVNEFKGYLIVQDPLNKSLDTSKLLIIGKIGN